jgi:acyl-CoA carboxylase subunit beta
VRTDRGCHCTRVVSRYGEQVPGITAAETIELIVDAGSWHSWDSPPPTPADTEYRDQLARASERAGTDESVCTGEATINGIRVALVVGEFGFLAGSVGAAAADRVVRGVRRATQESLPLLGLPTSGGTRMQEGTPAFLQMVSIAAAVAAHREAGLAYLVWLRDPTLGGVMATWGSLGQVCAAADPSATIGFLGARVFDAMNPGEHFPRHVQHADHLQQVGVIDAVVPPEQVRQWFARLLTALSSRPAGVTDQRAETTQDPQTPAPASIPDAWDCVQATRHPDRSGARELVEACATEISVLHGTATGERGDGVLLALARIGGTGCVIVAQDRSAEAPLGPAALRTARRGYQLAREWCLPVLTVVDTEGAEVSGPAEEGAIAGEIARNLADLSLLPVPVVSVLLGSGCGGGALAMLPADVLIAAADSWITPLPPEGAAAILLRSTDQAAHMARSQHITAVELAHLGVIDELITAPTSTSAREQAGFITAVAHEVTSALSSAIPSTRRVERFAAAIEILAGEGN